MPGPPFLGLPSGRGDLHGPATGPSGSQAAEQGSPSVGNTGGDKWGLASNLVLHLSSST